MVDGQAPRHSVSVAAVIVDGEQALAIRRRDNGTWEPPGGVLELEESITEGLRREVLEETGLLVEPSQLTGVYKNMTRYIVALVFRCRITDGTPRSTEECEEFRWLDSPAIKRLVDNQQMTEAFATRLLDALAGTTGIHPPYIRTHDGTAILSS